MKVSKASRRRSNSRWQALRRANLGGLILSDIRRAIKFETSFGGVDASRAWIPGPVHQEAIGAWSKGL